MVKLKAKSGWQSIELGMTSCGGLVPARRPQHYSFCILVVPPGGQMPYSQARAYEGSSAEHGDSPMRESA